MSLAVPSSQWRQAYAFGSLYWCCSSWSFRPTPGGGEHGGRRRVSSSSNNGWNSGECSLRFDAEACFKISNCAHYFEQARIGTAIHSRRATLPGFFQSDWEGRKRLRLVRFDISGVPLTVVWTRKPKTCCFPRASSFSPRNNIRQAPLLPFVQLLSPVLSHSLSHPLKNALNRSLTRFLFVWLISSTDLRHQLIQEIRSAGRRSHCHTGQTREPFRWPRYRLQRNQK